MNKIDERSIKYTPYCDFCYKKFDIQDESFLCDNCGRVYCSKCYKEGNISNDLQCCCNCERDD